MVKAIEIRINGDLKELYLYGELMATWDIGVDDLKVIVPYAIEKAVLLGEKNKAAQIRACLLIR